MNILNSTSLDNKNVPKDIYTLKKIFDNNNITEYEKSTLPFLSEFLNNYITDILIESKKNMNLSGRNKINLDDVKLSVKNFQNKIYKNKIDIKEMKKISEEINKKNLPNIPEKEILPSNESNLLRNNFQIYSKELEKESLNNINNNNNNNNIININNIINGINSNLTSSLKINESTFINNKRKSEFESIKNEKGTKERRRKLSLVTANKKNVKDKNIEKKNNNNINDKNNIDNNDKNIDKNNIDKMNIDDGDDEDALQED
jgi:hypothetical protein